MKNEYGVDFVISETAFNSSGFNATGLYKGTPRPDHNQLTPMCEKINDMNLPNDADGDVLRNLAKRQFDFSKKYEIDFNVDFEVWPPPAEAINTLSDVYSNAELIEDPDGEDNYVLFRIESELSYNVVVSTQAEATELVSKYGGRCESWGVLHRK